MCTIDLFSFKLGLFLSGAFFLILQFDWFNAFVLSGLFVLVLKSDSCSSSFSSSSLLSATSPVRSSTRPLGGGWSCLPPPPVFNSISRLISSSSPPVFHSAQLRLFYFVSTTVWDNSSRWTLPSVAFIFYFSPLGKFGSHSGSFKKKKKDLIRVREADWTIALILHCSWSAMIQKIWIIHLEKL